ncbi:MAG: hypothetical protein JO223_06600 [Hyphomicrobiales bacterium]|nr:hypothetical protein [Hyphomicrobiales bacterium]
MELLAKELKTSKNIAIARALNVSPALISNLSHQRRELSGRQLANIIKAVVNHTTENLIKTSVETIVEYFPVERHKIRTRWHPLNKASHPELAALLEKSIGIYVYYNSEGKVIYLGKAEKSLMGEMIQTYNRPFYDNYVIFSVKHPRDQFKPKPDGTMRALRKQQVILADTASFFSCYKVDSGLILPLEALMIRIAANNLINVRMEKALPAIGHAASI